MTTLTKAALLALQNTGVASLGDDQDAPGITVRGLKGSERDELGRLALAMDSEAGQTGFALYRRTLIASCMLGPDGKSMFSESEPVPDFDSLVIERCWQEIKVLSGIDDDAHGDIEGN